MPVRAVPFATGGVFDPDMTTFDIDQRISVAPMMDWTDRHCRYFLRGFSPRVLLYTEMITAAAIVHGDRERLLRYSEEEQPLALQLGGSEPTLLAAAARAGADSGYREINLNCGCPSDRVHAGAFGACLMLDAERVASAVAAMRAAVPIPVTRQDAHRRGGRPGRARPTGALRRGRLCTPAALHRACGTGRLQPFHRACAQSRARRPVAAREPRSAAIAVRRGAASEGRVSRSWSIAVNGGLRTTASSALQALDWSDGVMLGREAYHRPHLLAELQQLLFDDGWRCPDDVTLLERMAAYAEREVAAGERLSAITRHMLGLCSGRPGARRYRQWLSEGARRAPGRGNAAEARR